MPSSPRPKHPRRRGQDGFTLIEVLVSVAILTIIGGVFGGVFGVGYKTLGPQGSGARLAASSDLMSFEQLLSRDVSQASCVYIPRTASSPSGPYGPYGSCSQLFLTAGARTECSGPLTWNGVEGVPILCVAWTQVSADPSGDSCQVAVYGLVTSTNQFHREEYAIHANTPTDFDFESGQPVTASSQPALSVILSAPATTSGGTWITSLPVTVTTPSLSNPPTGSFILRPLVQDPAALASATGYPQC
ncbi:MAG: type II secretion system protein J [Candidatus Dormibacteria bacterium]